MNLDKLKNFPNQLTDGDVTECVALTVTDIAANIFGQLFSYDFTYAATLNLEGVPPTTAGSDPRTGMYTVPLYGLLPVTLETFTSKTMGELYAANFANYSLTQKAAALAFRMCAKPTALDYDDVVKQLEAGNPVALTMRWYWGSNPPTVLTVPPAGATPGSNHDVAAYDSGDPRGITIKPWLGNQLGDGGYFYLPREVFNVSVWWAMQFDSKASVALQAISLKIVYFPWFNNLFA